MQGSRGVGRILAFVEKYYHIIFCSISILIAQYLWGDRSLWLDEAMTFWVIMDGPIEAINRAIHYQGPGPLHFFITSFFIQLFGKSEVVIRLPSLLALVASFCVFYRFVLLFGNKSLAKASVALLPCLDFVLISGVTARGYSLGLLLVLLTSYSLFKWIENPLIKHIISFICFTTLMWYTHIFFAIMSLIHVFAFFLFKNTNKTITMLRFGLMYVIITILSTGVIYQYILMSERRQLLNWSLEPSFLQFLNYLFPVHLFFITLVSFVIVRISVPGKWVKKAFPSKLIYFLLLWYLIPPLILYISSITGSVSVFVYRYFFWVNPALALTISILVTSIQPKKARQFCILMILSASLFRIIYSPPSTEEWREAIEKTNNLNIKTNVPVIAYTGMAESKSIQWLEDSFLRNYILAPFVFYRLSTDIIPLPLYINAVDSQQYLENTVLDIVENVDSIILISRMIFIGDGARKTLVSDDIAVWFLKHGFVLEEKWEFIGVAAFKFVKNKT
jgi:uncharacterized membrane protein